jgi:hypothetical protein
MEEQNPQFAYSQQPEQQQPEGNRYDLPFGGYPIVNPQLKETTVISQTNPKFVIEELKHLLRGEEEHIDENGKSNWTKDKATMPLMNELGIKAILANLHGANQGVVFSNYDEENLLAIVRNDGYILIDKLGENMDDWGIEQGNLNTILYAILNAVYSSYRRGMNQGERVFVKTFYTENNTQVTRPIEMPQQRKKFLGIF